MTLPGVHADVVDGDRALRVRVDPPHRLLVRGLLGEPLLRFGAERRLGQPRVADRCGGPAREARLRLGARDAARTRSCGTTTASRRRLLCAPAQAPAGRCRSSLDGRATALRGTFTRVGAPPLWPWIVAMLVAFGARRGTRTRASGEASRDRSGHRRDRCGRRAHREHRVRDGRRDRAAHAVDRGRDRRGCSRCSRPPRSFVSDRSLRTWAAMVVGVVAASLGLGSLSVFWHGVVVSSLPASFARLATAVALVGGAAAVVLAVLAPTTGRAR